MNNTQEITMDNLWNFCLNNGFKCKSINMNGKGLIQMLVKGKLGVTIDTLGLYADNNSIFYCYSKDGPYLRIGAISLNISLDKQINLLNPFMEAYNEN